MLADPPVRGAPDPGNSLGVAVADKADRAIRSGRLLALAQAIGRGARPARAMRSATDQRRRIRAPPTRPT
jgi:hypothetical protein